MTTITLTAQRHLAGIASLAAFIASIPAANLAFQTWGAVPILFGFQAPAAALVVGFTFLLKDYPQRTYGPAVILAAIGLGAVLSYVLAPDVPKLALASGAAFLLSELLDMFVLDRLRNQGWNRAVAASNVAGAVVDSVAFLLIAFGSLGFLVGQLLAKGLATLTWLAWRGLRTP